MIIEEKGAVWTDKDFDQLGWNMSRLYSLTLPGLNHRLALHLDYVLESPLNKTVHGLYKIVPAKLEFFGVIDLKVNINQSNHSETDFVSVERSNERPTPSGNTVYWDYKIELSPYSTIEFTSTSFQQTLLAEPEITKFCDLDREMKF